MLSERLLFRKFLSKNVTGAQVWRRSTCTECKLLNRGARSACLLKFWYLHSSCMSRVQRKRSIYTLWAALRPWVIVSGNVICHNFLWHYRSTPHAPDDTGKTHRRINAINKILRYCFKPLGCLLILLLWRTIFSLTVTGVRGLFPIAVQKKLSRYGLQTNRKLRLTGPWTGLSR